MSLRYRAERLLSKFGRTKTMDKNMMETPLKRCLTTFDLTLLGIGNMTGAGIYVLTGTVVRNKAGAATFLSYLLAGITAFLNGLCYAELGSRIPKAGSAYSYTYYSSGELLAFIIGWSIILEYVLSASSIARGWSGTLNALTGNRIENGTLATIGSFPASDKWLAHYPDFIAFLIIALLALVVCLGPKLSVHFNSTMTSINVIIILMTTSVMFYFANTNNWSEAVGGFMPYNFGGIIAGAGTCFYAFIGFDAISISSEEAQTPERSLPIATAISVLFVSFLLVLSSAALTLYIDWQQVDLNAAFTAAFVTKGVTWASWITGIGSMIGISASLFCTVYALPRVVYAMASDGLIFRSLAKLTDKTKVPALAIVVFCLLAGILALLFDIETLADFLSIGTLIAYTIVASNVVILRYLKPQFYAEYPPISEDLARLESLGPEEQSPSSSLTCEMDSTEWTANKVPLLANIGKLKKRFQNLPWLRNSHPGYAAVTALIVYMFTTACTAALVLVGTKHITDGCWWAISFLVLFLIIIALCIFVMLIHEQNENFDTFKVPFVPVVPCICVALNIMLIVKLSTLTWVRFGIWLAAGLVIYFGYGIHHSSENMSLVEQEKDQGSGFLGYTTAKNERSTFPQHPETHAATTLGHDNKAVELDEASIQY